MQRIIIDDDNVVLWWSDIIVMCCVVLAIGINRGTDGDEKEQWMNSKQSMVYYINVVLHYMFYL